MNYISTIDELGIEYVVCVSESFGFSTAFNINPSDEVIRLINDIRISKSLTIYKKHVSLVKAAQDHADWMAKNNRHSHYGECRNTWADRAKIAGYKAASLMNIGENIGMGQTSPAQILKDWVGSSGHLKALLNRTYVHAGIGMSTSSNGTKYWCANFGFGEPDDVNIINEVFSMI